MDRVIVIGNGPVGQTCALLLARWGVAVLVLDERAGRDVVGSRAICQQRDVLDVWDMVGAGQRIAEEGLTWDTARTFYRDQELFSYRLPEQGESPFPPFVNLSQARTEQILDECVAAQPLIDVRWGHRVTGITQTGDGVEVTCTSQRFTGAYAVLCAGARGEDLRRSLGVSFDGQAFDERFLICDIRTELPGWRSERRFYFDPAWNRGRQVLIHPCPDSQFRIDWQVPADYDIEADQASGSLDDRVRAIIGETDYEIVWKSVYRFSSRIADRLAVGRVLLAGDCAHLYSPFGARGLNSGVADAENAAWKLAFVLHGWAPEALVATYHDERHAAAVENLDVTSATMRFLVPQDEAQRAHRLAVLDGARVSEVDSGRLSEPFWYTDSPLTTPNPLRPGGGRPERGLAPVPAPGTLIPDAPVGPARLRALARQGCLLLASTDRAMDTAAQATRLVAGPVRVLPLGVTSGLAAALAAKPDEIWVLRPDAHIAAVLPGPGVDDVVAALRRTLCHQA
jgi:pentachlorophenol monooxygenase/3-(3-hydroxy-phenyl)propionate hydroxylase